MSSKERILVEEYKALREEIIYTQRLRIQILTFSITAIGVVLGLLPKVWETHRTNDLLCLSPPLSLYAIIIPSSFIIRILSSSIKFIGAYISVYIENDLPELKWEKNAHKIRFKTGPRAITTGIAAAYLALSVLALFVTCISLTGISDSSQTRYYEKLWIFPLDKNFWLRWKLWSLLTAFSFLSTLSFLEVSWLYSLKGVKEDYIQVWNLLKAGKDIQEIQVRKPFPVGWFIKRYILVGTVAFAFSLMTLIIAYCLFCQF